jgi:hypothetical protein
VQQYKICRSSFVLLMVSIKLLLFVRPEAEENTAWARACAERGNSVNNYEFGMSKSSGQKVYIYSTGGTKAILDKNAW